MLDALKRFFSRIGAPKSRNQEGLTLGGAKKKKQSACPKVQVFMAVIASSPCALRAGMCRQLRKSSQKRVPLLIVFGGEYPLGGHRRGLA